MRRLVQVVLAASIFVILWAITELWVEGRSLTWPEVPARITESEAKVVAVMHSVTRSARPTESRWFELQLEYVYRLDGLDYRSSRISLLETPVWSGRAVQNRVARYPVGADVMVRVSPDDPAFSVLEPGFTPASLVLLAAAVSAAFGSLWMLQGLPVKRRPRR